MSCRTLSELRADLLLNCSAKAEAEALKAEAEALKAAAAEAESIEAASAEAGKETI